MSRATTANPAVDFPLDQCEDTDALSFWTFSATLNLIILILQTLVTIFVTYKALCSSGVLIALPLKIAMLVYHYFFLAYMVVLFIIYSYWTMNDNLNNPTSGASIDACLWSISSFLPPVIYIFAMTMFWFIRLKIVFHDSSLRVSKTTNKIMFTTIIASGVIFLILVIALYISQNHHCYTTFKLKGRLIDLTFSNNKQADTVHFCILDVSHTPTLIIINVFNILAAILVPTLNIIIAGLYIYKMCKLVGWQEAELNASNQELQIHDDTFERQRLTRMKRKLIRRSCIIAMISIFSTLISLFCWSALGTVGLPFLMIDGLVNGIAMFAVCQFGNWIYLLFTCNDCICFDVLQSKFTKGSHGHGTDASDVSKGIKPSLSSVTTNSNVNVLTPSTGADLSSYAD